MCKSVGAYGNNIAAEFCGLPGEFGEFPGVHKTMSSVMFGTILSTFGEQLEIR